MTNRVEKMFFPTHFNKNNQSWEVVIVPRKAIARKESERNESQTPTIAAFLAI